MKTVFLSSLLLTSLSLFAQERVFNNLGVSEDTTFGLSEQSKRIKQLDSIIVSTQKFISEKEDEVELMAIVGNSTEPISLPDRQWPENVTTSINIIRAEDGSLKYYSEYPSSESGDWFLGYRYYFDQSKGKVLVFERMANFFNNECSSGVAKELSTYYFSSAGELIAKSYSLVNNDGDDLTEKLCFFPYDYEYEIAKSAMELLK